MYSLKNVSEMQKAATAAIKEVDGRGPDNIYIKFRKNYIDIYVEGVISKFEKHLIKEFGKEAIDVFESFYSRDCYRLEERFKESLPFKLEYQFDSLESDFVNDKFIFKMKRS